MLPSCLDKMLKWHLYSTQKLINPCLWLVDCRESFADSGVGEEVKQVLTKPRLHVSKLFS